jgi:hypothetical protein
MADHIDMKIIGYIQILKKRRLTLERMIETFDPKKSKDPTWILNELEAVSFAIVLLKDLYDSADDGGDHYGYEMIVTKNGERL